MREILEHVYSCEVRSDKLDKDRIINQALSDLKQEILGKLPKEKYHVGVKNNSRFNKNVDGFNEALAQVRKIVEEL